MEEKAGNAKHLRQTKKAEQRTGEAAAEQKLPAGPAPRSNSPGGGPGCGPL